MSSGGEGLKGYMLGSVSPCVQPVHQDLPVDLVNKDYVFYQCCTPSSDEVVGDPCG